ncbi:MAG: hypothetical protein ACR2QK_02365 [Acidimicrobiales bacterium]
MRYLLVIDTAGDVVLADADNGVRMPIGEPLAPAQRSRVSSAVWSPGGEWTAWSVDSDDLDGVDQLRCHDEETDRWWVLAESVKAFYLCPSPGGRWLSHLSPGPLGLELALSEIGTGDSRIVERGQPMFWSWSPDEARLAIHVEDRVVISDVDGSGVELLRDGVGPFVTPWWLPGGSVAYVVDDRIVSEGPDGLVTTLVERGVTGRFSPDPEGRRMAHIERFDGGHRLVVVDLLSGELRVVAADPIGPFFWSPSGDRLAALVDATEGRVRWLVFDGADLASLPPFRPGRSWAGSVLPFFEQYAQSHAHWSPDGRRLVAPAVGDDGAPGALIQDLDDADRQQWIADVELVWWA